MNDSAIRVLVVDDEAPMREELALLLQEHDLLVETAANGEEGLAKLRMGEFDVAVVDLKMPKMDGLEMIRRADAEEIDVYVIILTGRGDKDDAVAALRLRNIVRDWFDKSSLRDEEFVQRVKSVTGDAARKLVSKIMSKLPPVPELR